MIEMMNKGLVDIALFLEPVDTEGMDYIRITDCDHRCVGMRPDEWFSHLAIEVPGENGSNEWLEPVSDEVCVCNSIKQMLEASVIPLTGAFCNIKFTLLSTL